MKLVTLLPFYSVWDYFVLAHVRLCIQHSFLFKSHICSRESITFVLPNFSLWCSFHYLSLGEEFDSNYSICKWPSYEQIFNHQQSWPTFQRPSRHVFFSPLIAYPANKPYLLNTSLVQSTLPGSLEDVKKSTRY